MKKGLLSIIVPVYNGEAHLIEALDSLQRSLYRQTEFLLIDDGSTDKSGKICRDYAERDFRFRWIRQENRGTAAARNRGLLAADGEYVGFCDQDDLVHEAYYASAIRAMERDGSDICICSSSRFYETGDRRSGPYEMQKDALYVGREIREKLLMPTLLNGYIAGVNDEILARGTIWNCVIRKEIIDRYGLQFQKKIRFEDDWRFRADVLLKAERASAISLCGYRWRTNPRSESHKKVYIRHIAQKQADTREHIYRQLQENGLPESAEQYLSCQKCFDMIKILENERAIRRPPRKRRQYLRVVLGELNTPDVKAASLHLKKGELRYRLILYLIRREKYLAAFSCNAFLMGLRDMLYRFRLAYLVEETVHGNEWKAKGG